MGVKISLGENSGPTFLNEKTGHREPKDEYLRIEMGLPPYSSRWTNNKFMKNTTDKTEFWTNLGEGISAALIILALCIGIGGCKYIVMKSQSLNQVPVTAEQKN